MSEESQSIPSLTDEALQALLKRAIRNTLILGVLVSVALAISSPWGTGALFLSGALISAASIFEWQRLVRLINSRMGSRMRSEDVPRGAGLAIAFILVRLIVFGGVIYGSLKCFQGSPIALVCGLSLAVVTLTWEALGLLRG
jgi:Na+/H+-translocating membrane pyrophosphatase